MVTNDGAKRKGFISKMKSRPSLSSSPHEEDLYSTEKISSSYSKLGGSTSSSLDSRKHVYSAHISHDAQLQM